MNRIRAVIVAAVLIASTLALAVPAMATDRPQVFCQLGYHRVVRHHRYVCVRNHHRHHHHHDRDGDGD